MKHFRPAYRQLLLGLVVLNVALFVVGCADKPAEKTADPAQIEESRKKHEEMSMKERGS